MPTESPKMCRKARKGFGIMGKTTRRKYDPKFKMRVALEVYKGEKTLSQVASENGIAPSLAAEWRDQLLDEGATDVFGKTKQAREEGQGGSRCKGARRAAEDDRPAHRRARLPPAVLRRVRLRPGRGAGRPRVSMPASPARGPRSSWAYLEAPPTTSAGRRRRPPRRTSASWQR